MPSGLLSWPSSERRSGRSSALHMNSLCLVKMLVSRVSFFPAMQMMPRARPPWTRLAPRMAAMPMSSCPARKPMSELMISGELAAVAMTRSPMMASLRPSFLAYEEMPNTIRSALLYRMYRLAVRMKRLNKRGVMKRL